MTNRTGNFSQPVQEQPLWDVIQDHGRIVIALARRDVRSRFGEEGVGYLASFVAPLAWIAATFLAFDLFGRTSPVYTDLISFIISGLIPYALFRYTVTAIGRANSSVRKLLIYPKVREEHAYAAAALVEAFNALIIFPVVMAANLLIYGKGELSNPAGFLWGSLLCMGLGASYAYLFAVLGRVNERFQQVGQILLRPTFFLSAIFFTANELPQRFLDILSWNPLLHAIEIARDGMLFHYESRIASSSYVLLIIGALSLAGYLISMARRV